MPQLLMICDLCLKYFTLPNERALSGQPFIQVFMGRLSGDSTKIYTNSTPGDYRIPTWLLLQAVT